MRWHCSRPLSRGLLRDACARLAPAALGLAMMTGAAVGADYRRVMMDEFTRGYLATQDVFTMTAAVPQTGVIGGMFQVPGSVANGRRIRENFVNFTAQYLWDWSETRFGDIQPFVRVRGGGTWYEGNYADAGMGREYTHGDASAVSFLYGLSWSPFRQTTISISMNYGYMYARNCHTGAPPSPLQGQVHNWFAHVATTSTEIGFRQGIPIHESGWRKGSDFEPRFVLFANVSSVAMFGAYGSSNHQNRFAGPFVISSGVEFELPFVATLTPNPAPEGRIVPFVERVDILCDGQRSLGRDKCFYRAGVQFRGGPERRQAEKSEKSDWYLLERLNFSAAAIWGAGISGWQIGAGISF